jgi:hypothetical protein
MVPEDHGGTGLHIKLSVWTRSPSSRASERFYIQEEPFESLSETGGKLRAARRVMEPSTCENASKI